MSGPSIEVTTSEDFEPSDRLRSALQDLAATAPGSGDAEVEGFGAGLTVGDVGFKTTAGPQAAGWRDGCWGYSSKPDNSDVTCGWYQEGGTSCVGFTTKE